MEKISKLFESLDEKVFTAELRESLETQFNEAVEAKTNELVEAKIEILNEKSEQHIEFLNEKAEQYVEMKQTEMLESLDKYLDRIVEEFMQEAKASLDESLKSEKADAIIEAFDSMIVATGVEVAKIVEAKDDSAIEKKLEESISKYDSLVEENISLKETNEQLLKAGIIAESKEGLSLIESEKFEKLAALVEFTNDDAFVQKLEVIKESVKGAVEAKEEKIEESVPTKSAWSHLV